MEKKIKFNEIKGFKFFINHLNTHPHGMTNVHDSHSHRECEIYINLSGNVSFMVESTVYPIQRGSVIITRPHENHHCIYHSDSMHEHYWILFESNENEDLLDIFFSRALGECNLIVLSAAELDKVTKICSALFESANYTQSFYLFFSLMEILKNGQQQENKHFSVTDDIAAVLDYMNSHIAEKITVEELAKKAFVSLNTFERRFKNQIGMSAKEYLTQKRLNHACRLLDEGVSVQEACYKSGFSDCSHFIQQFRRRIGVTPRVYKNEKQK